jgi:hypothetical protein
MPVIITPESELGTEMAKWNKPYKFEPFPQMLYRAQRRNDGVVLVIDLTDETFSRSCWQTVNNEAERQNALEGGWRESPAEALAFFESRARDVADEAARRAAADQRMSEKAQQEAATAEAATPEHVPAVPEAPRRRGRPPKIKE